MSRPDVVLNEDLSRFEYEDEGHTAFLSFTRSGEVVTLVHTEVPEQLEGQGVGTSLVRAALAYVRDNDLSVVPKCPFVVSYLRAHPEEATDLGLDPSEL